MKRYTVVLLILFVFAVAQDILANDIEWDDIGKGNLNVKAVAVNPDNPRFIYIGSHNAVLKSEDGGITWQNVLSVKGQDRAVNLLLFCPRDKDSLYAATGNGLFYGVRQGRSWKRIFQGKNYLERECTALAVLPYAMYVGTKSGLFMSKDRGRSWHREAGELGNAHISCLTYGIKEPGYLYVASSGGVFRSMDAGMHWERTFVSQQAKNEIETEELPDEQPEELNSPHLRCIAIDPNNAGCLYLASSQGVYLSQDKAKTWEPVSSYGLLSQDIRFLSVSNASNLYAMTKSGVFEFKGNRWQELSLRLAAQDFNYLVLDKENNLYVASQSGLFKTQLSREPDNCGLDTMVLYSQGEPGIREVQLAAVKYAEVEPEKIIKWRRQAARRAWLPKITIDMDRDMDRTTSNSIWGTYSSNGTPGRYFAGPDDITKYNNKNWGVSLTWELADLIWSDDQANIDVRSRLMVELRDDILDTVTKLYFERLRLKMEIDSLSIEKVKKRRENELRLEELAASLDALTGGYFTDAINAKKGPSI